MSDTNKLYKTIKKDNTEIKIYELEEEIELIYEVPEWNEESEEYETCFKYNDYVYYLSEFMNIHNEVYNPNPPEWMKEFDGYRSDSYFSGLLIKLIGDEAVKVYTYTS